LKPQKTWNRPATKDGVIRSALAMVQPGRPVIKQPPAWRMPLEQWPVDVPKNWANAEIGTSFIKIE